MSKARLYHARPAKALGRRSLRNAVDQTVVDKASAGAEAGSRPTSQADWWLLMRRAQDGDQRAYVALLTAITPYLRVLARRVGVRNEEVEDAVQDVLLAIHLCRHTYDPARPFGPWLAAVARHRLVDYQRGRGRARVREVQLTRGHETFVGLDANFYERIGDGDRLRVAIARLPAGQRQAVEMLRLKELSLHEASAASGQSVAGLKVALHRAIKRLRVLLV